MKQHQSTAQCEMEQPLDAGSATFPTEDDDDDDGDDNVVMDLESMSSSSVLGSETAAAAAPPQNRTSLLSAQRQPPAQRIALRIQKRLQYQDSKIQEKVQLADRMIDYMSETLQEHFPQKEDLQEYTKYVLEVNVRSCSCAKMGHRRRNFLVCYSGVDISSRRVSLDVEWRLLLLRRTNKSAATEPNDAPEFHDEYSCLIPRKLERQVFYVDDHDNKEQVVLMHQMCVHVAESIALHVEDFLDGYPRS